MERLAIYPFISSRCEYLHCRHHHPSRPQSHHHTPRIVFATGSLPSSPPIVEQQGGWTVRTRSRTRTALLTFFANFLKPHWRDFVVSKAMGRERLSLCLTRINFKNCSISFFSLHRKCCGALSERGNLQRKVFNPFSKDSHD